MERTLEDLKLEADSLGIEYPKNIGVNKLQEKIDTFYDNESKSAVVAVEATDVEEPTEAEHKKAKSNARLYALAIIRAQEVANMKNVVIKITMVDRREASTATNVYLGTGDVAMNLPLDTWVEVPSIIAELAKDAKATVHMETDKGAVPKTVNKFVVEYK
jgi:hypothetical protein